MDEAKFKSIYGESRNGCNYRVRHPMCRKFLYSDGVKDLAEVGMYWLLDIVGTEVAQAIKKHANEFGGMAFLHAVVKDGKADLSLVRDDGETPKWERHSDFTDLPEGKWIFYLADEGDGHVFMYLPSEY
jgi:hypothetical protein